jgi:hypothetical protein
LKNGSLFEIQRVELVESGSSGKRKRVEAGPMDVALLDEIANRLLSIEKMMAKQIPEGIVEPLNPISVTSSGRVVQPPFPNKFWFSITIVKEDAVELHLSINTETATVPYTMSANEKVYDQSFSIPCIRDVKFWTNQGETCTVKIRGSR